MNPIGWFEIYVEDLDACVAFYEKTLSVTLVPNEVPMPNLEMRMFPADYNSYGASGAICRMKGVPAGANSTMVYFSCGDCSVPESKVAEAGGEVIASKFSLGKHGFITVAKDPDGNTIGFHSMN